MIVIIVITLKKVYEFDADDPLYQKELANGPYFNNL